MAQKLTLRRVIHDLLNKNGGNATLASIGIATINPLLEDDSFSPQARKTLQETLKILEGILQDAQAADSMLQQIRTFLYTKIDPDTTGLEFTIEG